MLFVFAAGCQAGKAQLMRRGASSSSYGCSSLKSNTEYPPYYKANVPVVNFHPVTEHKGGRTLAALPTDALSVLPS